MRPRYSLALASAKRPRFTWPIQIAPMFFMPPSSHSCFASFSTTDTPFCTKQMAMPPPMSPAPTMPTFLMGAEVALLPGTLLARRSAKKRCRMAADCTLKSKRVNSFPSTFKPSWKLMPLHAARTQLMMASGAIMPLACWEAWFSAMSSAPPRALKRFAFGTGRLEMGSGFLDNAICAASSMRLPLAMASMTPAFAALSILSGAPVMSIGSATSRGATRGIRCVPSPPGRRPSCTSGKPTDAFGAATR
mmetsp:Transcript_37913/g.114529  ORF Transcript_37913/g.114529 Transcript_37913/m.114529 type:complete len:248 (+) Transcript_37913:1292-2035(+)